MLKKTFSSLFLFFLLFLQIDLFAKTIHAIIIADTVHDISHITKPDLKNLQNELQIISKHTKSILKEKIFSGYEFKKDNIIKYINNLKVGPSDSVIFYFSGHGYRTMQKKTPLPFLSFELFKIGLDMQWVADTLWAKNPQFALILADCCNNFAEKGIMTKTKNVLINLHKITPHFPGYRSLFINAKGCVVVCSCSSGQFSYGSEFGGLFTQCFLVSLNKEICQPKPSWKNLLLRASSYIGHIQKPFCQIYTERAKNL